MKTTCHACGQTLPEPCGLVVDGERGEVRYAGMAITLTAKHMRVLQSLLHGRGRVVSKEAVFNACYFDQPGSEDINSKIIDVFICKVRKSLEPFKAHGVEIKTHHGRGFELIVPGLKSKADPAPLLASDIATLQYGGPRA